MRTDDYRKRFFEKYITAHWEFSENISPASFKLLSKVYAAHYGAHLPAEKSTRILDLACGPGHLLHFLQGLGYADSHGVDLGTEQVETAKKMGVRNVVAGDLLEYLKSGKDRFDLIIASHIIEHMKKEEAIEALDLASAALKSGGKVLVSTPNAMPLQGMVMTFGDFTHEMALNSKSLSQLLRVCGFSEVEVFGLGPVGHDLRSHLRASLFDIIKRLRKLQYTIEYGTGRSIWSPRMVFEPVLLGVGKKI